MYEYEELLREAADEGVTVIENYDLTNTRIKGLYCDGTVALSRNIRSTKERTCILAEKLGHYHTTYGDIIAQASPSDRKQETHARMWAYNRMIGLTGIINAYKHGCHSQHEAAEYLNVPEEFLIDSIEFYRAKYGTHVAIDNYIIYFEPAIAVLELI